MKKLMIVSLMSLVPMLSFAKVADFNAMITDNLKAQTQLHATIQKDVSIARVAGREKQVEGSTVVDTGSDSYNAPTSKDALIFEKEKRQPKKSEHAQFERLATEIEGSDF